MKRGESTGTSIRYWYDARYFETGAVLDVEAVRTKLRNTAFLVPRVGYVLRDATGGRARPVPDETFHFPNGLTDMVDFLSPAGDRPVSGTLLFLGEGTYKENAADENGVMRSNVERRAEVEVALRWGTGYERALECFANTIRNVHGGTHRKGFERALVRALTEAMRNTRGLLKPKEEPPVLDDILEGMTAVVHVRLPEPQFTSQTKDELSTAGITKVVQTIVEQHLKEWIENRKTKSEASTVLQKIMDAARVRLTQKQQKDAARRKTALEGASMPPKLVDCRSPGSSAASCSSWKETARWAPPGWRARRSTRRCYRFAGRSSTSRRPVCNRCSTTPSARRSCRCWARDRAVRSTWTRCGTVEF